MSKVAQYLQEHLAGEVADSAEIRRYYSTDASILKLTPLVVAFPANEDDVRKAARFSWQLAERGQSLPITVRGGGTDTTGAAIGGGLILAVSRHLNQLTDLDIKKHLAVVQPGITFDQLERILQSHGLTLPPQPATAAAATVGGGIANDSIGQRSLKYGSVGDYIESLRVVLANGEVIETRPLKKRELSKKLGQSGMEGEIYRQLDTLLEDNAEVIKAASRPAVFTSHGYKLAEVKRDGNFDLTPLFLGAQGSLGVITEATLRLEPSHTEVSEVLVSFDSLDKFEAALPKILELNPSLLEMFSRSALSQAARLNPALYKNVVVQPAAAIHLFAEFDNFKQSDQQRLKKNLKKIVEKAGGDVYSPKETSDRENFEKLRRSHHSIMSYADGHDRPVPVGENLSIPVENLGRFLRAGNEWLESLGLEAAFWGSAGHGNISYWPMLDLGEIGDRQKLFKIKEKLYPLAIEMGGQPSANAEGRTRAYLNQQIFGNQLHDLMLQVKKIFDPHSILNAGVKTASLDDMKSLINDQYEFGQRNLRL